MPYHITRRVTYRTFFFSSLIPSIIYAHFILLLPAVDET